MEQKKNTMLEEELFARIAQLLPKCFLFLDPLFFAFEKTATSREYCVWYTDTHKHDRQERAWHVYTSFSTKRNLFMLKSVSLLLHLPKAICFLCIFFSDFVVSSRAWWWRWQLYSIIRMLVAFETVTFISLLWSTNWEKSFWLNGIQCSAQNEQTT